jgi:hypothetical protein
MNINRNNYEAFFIDYVHNELSVPEKLQLENFIALHPELEEELHQLKETILTPDLNVQIGQKESLYKKALLLSQDQAAIESLIIRDLDAELTAEEKEKLHLLLQKNTDYHQLAQHYAQTKFTEAPEQPFPDKERLLKPVNRNHQRIYWITRLAAAAICLLVTGLYFWQTPSGSNVKIEVPRTSSHPLDPGNVTPLTIASTSVPSVSQDRINSPLNKKDQQERSTLNKKAVPLTSRQELEHASELPTEALTIRNLNPAPIPKIITTENTNSYPIAASTVLNYSPAVTDEAEIEFPLTQVEADGRENHKIREVFRKITRTVERAVYQKNDPATEQIRIASFQIALK